MPIPVSLIIEVDGVRIEREIAFGEPTVFEGSGAPAKLIVVSPQGPYVWEQVTPGVFRNEAGCVSAQGGYAWLKPVLPGKKTMYINFARANPFVGFDLDYRVKIITPELAYIPATSEPGQPSSDNPAVFAPLLKADGFTHARIWSNLLVTYGNIDAWHAAGLKPIVTTTFDENATLGGSCSPTLYANNIATTVQRLRNAAIVQFWNEPQFGHYYPSDVPRDVAGLKKIFNEYYKMLSQGVGRARMAGPSVLPHYEGKQWLQMLVDAGFYDPAYTTYADLHLYFGRWSSRQQIIDTVSDCVSVLPTGIKLISTEFGKDIHDNPPEKDAQGNVIPTPNYISGNLRDIYATYATLGISPMAHFMGGTMNKFAAHTKGIYSRTGQRINDDVRACVAKVNAAVAVAGGVP